MPTRSNKVVGMNNLRTAAIQIGLNADASLPDWIELVKVGRMEGRDGRWFVNDKPEDVIATFVARKVDIVIDWEHASEVKFAERVPAAGWVTELQVRDGAIWGRVRWTEQGASDVKSGTYRYISPSFYIEKKTNRVTQLASVALVHQPNLDLKALSSENPPSENPSQHKEIPMPLAKIARELGLNEAANEDQVLAELQKLKSSEKLALQRAEAPELSKFVPRADFDAMEKRAMNAEAFQTETTANALKARAEAAVNRGLTEGKITPATKDYYLAQCKSEADLKNLEDFLGKALPVIAPGVTPTPPAGAVGTAALNAEEKAVCKQLGLTEEEFLKSKNSQELKGN